MDAETRTRVKRAIDAAVRAKNGINAKGSFVRPGRPVVIDFEQEVDQALAFYNRQGLFPPVVVVPSQRGRIAYRLARVAT